ncbi:zinc finger CCHC domain-containing protein 7-like, partial [Scleropages formosus]
LWLLALHRHSKSVCRKPRGQETQLNTAVPPCRLPANSSTPSVPFPTRLALTGRPRPREDVTNRDVSVSRAALNRDTIGLSTTGMQQERKPDEWCVSCGLFFMGWRLSCPTSRSPCRPPRPVTSAGLLVRAAPQNMCVVPCEGSLCSPIWAHGFVSWLSSRLRPSWPLLSYEEELINESFLSFVLGPHGEEGLERTPLRDSAGRTHLSKCLSVTFSTEQTGIGHETATLPLITQRRVLTVIRAIGDESCSRPTERSPDGTEDHDNDDYNWSISAKDMKAQIANRGPGTRRLASRYYEKKNVTCRNCNKTGHLSKSCSTPKKLPSCLLCGTQGHLQRSCPHHFCSNCMLPGHGYEDCLEPAYWHKQCHRCSMTGHFQDSCPEVWRQYHLTTRVGPPVKPVTRDAPRSPAYCYNCSRKGHFGFECKDRRMFNGTYPTAPYISYYDTPKDIRYRNNRMKRKAENLQEAGLLGHPEPGRASEGQAAEEGAPPAKKRKKNRGGLCKEGKEGKERTPTANAKREQKQLQLKAKPWPEKRKERRQLKKLRKQSAAQQPGKKQQCPLQEEKDFPRGSLKKVKSGPKSTLKCKPDINLFSLFQERERKGKKRQAKARDRQAGAPTKEDRCPVDENLFLIKQRKKCKRKTSRN